MRYFKKNLELKILFIILSFVYNEHTLCFIYKNQNSKESENISVKCKPLMANIKIVIIDMRLAVKVQIVVLLNLMIYFRNRNLPNTSTCCFLTIL